ncbi:MAG: hypothetical protein EXS14_06125, partial [Planctomycetes bacterium]|nr:hypothetical protein [Planctomycetota bacterium]
MLYELHIQRSLLLSLLCASALWCQAGLPPVPVPLQNPLTPAKVTLGKLLFWEEQVSSDNTTACGTCHMPEVGGGDPRIASALNLHPGSDGLYGTTDDIRGSRGVVSCDSNSLFVNDGTFFPRAIVTGRKAPPAIGAQWDPESFWDGRASGQFKDPLTGQVIIPIGGALESQAVMPPLSGEMGCAGRNMATICNRLVTQRPMRLAASLPADMAAAVAQYTSYPALFQWAFGDPSITPVRFAFAIASYERTLVPDQTPWDDYEAGNLQALTVSQIAGKDLFDGNANCTFCHTPPLFTDHLYHNIGVRPSTEDMGRRMVTLNNAHRGQFKTPHLRNIALRAPYFHTGGSPTLASVMDFYEVGGHFFDNIDPAMVSLVLTPTQKAQLLDFVQHAFTDPRVAQALPPFDRPVLLSEQSLLPQSFGAATPGSNGHSPTMLAPVPAVIGTDHFAFGVHSTLGGANGIMGFTLTQAVPPIV